MIGVVPEPLKHRGNVAHAGFGVAENDGRFRVFDFNDTNQRTVLVHAPVGLAMMGSYSRMRRSSSASSCAVW